MPHSFIFRKLVQDRFLEKLGIQSTQSEHPIFDNMALNTWYNKKKFKEAKLKQIWWNRVWCYICFGWNVLLEGTIVVKPKRHFSVLDDGGNSVIYMLLHYL